MPLPADLQEDWPVISQLLDEALTLPAAQRDAFLDGLPAEHAPLRNTLRELLARADGVETAAFLATLPRFTEAAARGPLTELAAGESIGPYRLISELGAGGMGAVWLAERADGALKRKVALKLPRLVWARGLAERMARERDILATLEHPNIARLYDAGVDQYGRPYLALEYVEGQPIDVYARERGLSVRDKLQLLLQVCNAVAFAHSRLVVHRDLKPSNILVTQDGQVRLLDFGIAKLMEGDSTKETQLTQLAGRALTLDYASPEQIKGEPIGTASDVYSLGVVAYELLTGAKPYKLKRGSAAELEDAIANAEVMRASDRAAEAPDRKALRGDLDAILGKSLKKELTRRYQTVDGLADDVRRHLFSQPVLARPDTWHYRAGKVLVRYRWQLALSSVALLSVGVAAIVAMHQALLAASERDRVRLALQTNEQVQEFVTSLFAVPDPPDSKYIDQGLERIRKDEGKVQDAVRARMLFALGNLYSSIGQDERARAIYVESADLASSTRDYATAAEVLAVLAINLANNPSDNEQARETASRAMALAEEHAPDDARLLGRLNSALTVALTNLGRYDEAMTHAERAVRLHEAADGPGHVRTLAARGDEARVLHRSGRLERAEAQYRQLLSDMARDLGVGHANQLLAMENFGSLLGTMKKFDEAEATLRESIAIRASRFGPEHSTSQGAYSILGRVLLEAGKPAEAAPVLDLALRLEQRSDSAPSRFKVYLHEMLVAAAMDAGRFAEAEDWFRRGDQMAMRADAEQRSAWRAILHWQYFSRVVIVGRGIDEGALRVMNTLGDLPAGSNAALTRALLEVLAVARKDPPEALARLSALDSSLTPGTAQLVRQALLLAQARLARSADELLKSERLYSNALQEPLSSQRCAPRYVPAGREWADLLAKMERRTEQEDLLKRIAPCASALPEDSPRTAATTKPTSLASQNAR